MRRLYYDANLLRFCHYSLICCYDNDLDDVVHGKLWFFIDETPLFLTFHRRTAQKKRLKPPNSLILSFKRLLELVIENIFSRRSVAVVLVKK